MEFLTKEIEPAADVQQVQILGEAPEHLPVQPFGELRQTDSRGIIMGEYPKKFRMSILALIAILAVATSWSMVARAGFLSWDPHYYFGILQDKTWPQIYPFEQTMFWIMNLVGPRTFASYMFSIIAISLFILLVAFRRLGYLPIDQFILIWFFSCSYYGLHFMVTFQRQFFGILFLILASAGGRGSLLSRTASLFSHIFTFSLHVFWTLGRLSAPWAVFVSLAAVTMISSFSKALLPTNADHYGSYGEGSLGRLLLKQVLTVTFSIIILMTIKAGKSRLKSMTCAYIALSIPVAISPYYAGLFARLDYFFFPMLIACWPGCVREDRILICRLSIGCLTIIGFYLWMTSNFVEEVMCNCQ